MNAAIGQASGRIMSRSVPIRLLFRRPGMDSVKTILKEHLTPRQVELLRAIVAFQQSRCYSPTIGELADELGVSRSTTFEHIEELRKKGYLTERSSRARSLILTSKAYKLLKQAENQQTSDRQQQEEGIPLAGRVAAGVPIEAVENKEFPDLSIVFLEAAAIFLRSRSEATV